MPQAVKTNRKTRTYARHRTKSRKGNEHIYESDGKYFLKLVLCIIFGAVWLKFASPLVIGNFSLNGIPIGLFAGLLVVSRYEKFQYDRKIWYAILIIATMISLFLPSPIYF